MTATAIADLLLDSENVVARLHHLDGLKIESTLADLPAHDLSVGSEMPGLEVHELFAAHPDAPGVIIADRGRYMGMLPRNRFLECLSQPFSRDLYFCRPIAQLLATIETNPLCLASTERIELAARTALLRPAAQLYDPVVVVSPDGRHTVVDMRVILLSLASVLDATNHQNGQLLENVQSYVDKLEITLNELRMTEERLVSDIQARERTERQLRDNRIRMLRQTTALQEIATLDAVRNPDFERTLKDISRIAALTLRIESVSIWLTSEEPPHAPALRRAAEHSNKNPPPDAAPLTLDGYPLYHKALQRDLFLAVADVEADIRVAELLEPVLQPAGITALVHVCVIVAGRQIGVLRCDHVGSPREWTEDEQNFVKAVANFIALTTIGQDRNLALHALHESEQRLLQILETSPVGVCLIERNGRIRFSNPSLGDLFQRERETLAATDFVSLYVDSGRHRDCLARFEAEGGLRGVETDFFRSDGAVRWAIMSWDRARFAGQDVIVVWLFDITDLKEVEESLRQAKEQAEAATRAKSIFLATMSHEIRTPMNGVLGMLEVLDGSTLDSDQQHSVTLVRESALSLLRIIDDILDLSKIEAGRVDLEQAPVAMDELAEGVAATLRPIAWSKSLRLVTFVDPAIPRRLTGDPLRLRQILFNLLGNALKFTSAGQVTLRVDLQSLHDGCAKLRFSVIDTGIGLTREQASRLFEPFTQAEISTHRRFGGTGLGLSICRLLAQLMGGQISVESEPGHGSAFLVDLSLPCAEALAAADPPLRLDGTTIVLAMPHDDERAFAIRYLEADGARVAAFAETRQAQDWADENCRTSPGNQTVIMLDEWAEACPSAGLPVIRLTPDHKPLRHSALTRMVAAAAGKATVATCAPYDPRPAIPQIHMAPGGRILVADDHPINCEVILRQLAMLGCAADAVNDGREALAALERHPYVLLLTDCDMPEMDGFELTRAVRDRERACRQETPLPILGLTANAQASVAEACVAEGMNDCLIKPVDTVRLGRSLAKWLPVAMDDGSPPALASPVSDKTPPIDDRAFADVLGDDRAAIRGLMERYLRSSAPIRDELNKAIAQGASTKAVQRHAHKLKGASGMVRAAALAQLCLELEQAAALGNWTALAGLAPRLDEEWGRIERFIRGY